MSAHTPSAKVCLKCGYERRAHDAGPAAACPSCGAIYAKVEAAFRKDGPPKAAASAPDNSPTMAVEYIDATRRRMAHVIYLLFALPTGVTALMGYSLAKANRDNYSDEIAAAHNDWQYETLSTLVWPVLALIAMAVVLGLAQAGYWLTNDLPLHRFAQRGGAVLLVLAGALYAWILLRTVRGWLQLARGAGP